MTFWTFNGTFRKASKECSIKDITPTPVDEMDEFNITDLPLYPIEYASSEIADALRKRGKMYWKCRFRNYVGLAQETSEEIQDSVNPPDLYFIFPY